MSERADALGRLAREEIRDLLAKGWLTHDGMWFVHAAAELGVDQANALNRAAIRSMSEIETHRLVEALGVDVGRLTTSEDLCRFLTDGFELLLPRSVAGRIEVNAPDPSIVQVGWDEGECFAFKGMKRAGLLDRYECGVIYRIACWLEALGIPHRIDPSPGRCQMRLDGRCSTTIHLTSEPRPQRSR